MLTSAILVLGKQRQEDCYKFETSLGYRYPAPTPTKQNRLFGTNDSSRRHRMEIIPPEWEQHHSVTVWERTLAWFTLQNALAQVPHVDNVKYFKFISRSMAGFSLFVPGLLFKNDP